MIIDAVSVALVVSGWLIAGASLIYLYRYKRGYARLGVIEEFP